MKFSEKLLKNYECGKMTVVRDDTGLFRIFSTMGPDGLLRQTTKCVQLETAMESIGSHDGFESSRINEQAEEESWQIIKTIDFSELGGKGYKKGAKVRVIETGKVWTVVRVDECGVYCYLQVSQKPGTGMERYFEPKEIEPYFEDEEECSGHIQVARWEDEEGERIEVLEKRLDLLTEVLKSQGYKFGDGYFTIPKKKKS